MAHLDAVLDDRGAARGEEHSLPPMATNTLLFTNLPAAFFDTPELLNSMLDLLRAHGTLVQFTPLPAFERASAVFKNAWEAWAVKRSLDRLVMVFEGDEYDDAPRHATELSAAHSGRCVSNRTTAVTDWSARSFVSTSTTRRRCSRCRMARCNWRSRRMSACISSHLSPSVSC